MLSRIRALIRRNRQTVYHQDGLSIDLEKCSVIKDGKPIYLTSTEFQLLSALITNAGKVMDRSSLLQSIWDDAGMFIEDNTLSVHISRLREKIGARQNQNDPGIGYLWEDVQ